MDGKSSCLFFYEFILFTYRTFCFLSFRPMAICYHLKGNFFTLLTWHIFSLWHPKMWKQTDMAMQIWKHRSETFPMMNSILVTCFLKSGSTTKLSYNIKPKKNIHPVAEENIQGEMSIGDLVLIKRRRSLFLPNKWVHILIVSFDHMKIDLRQSRYGRKARYP